MKNQITWKSQQKKTNKFSWSAIVLTILVFGLWMYNFNSILNLLAK